MFHGITDLTTFILGTVFIVLLPGPNSLFVMTLASRQGIATGYRGACGIFLGDLILMVLSATGAASLLHAQPFLFMLLKFAGAGYLVWLGVGLLRSAMNAWRQEGGAGDTGRNEGAASRPFRTALFISLMNPKAIFFFVSFFIQFVSPGYAHPERSFLILGGIVQACSALYLSALILGGVHLSGIFRQRQKLSAAATGGVGVLFIGFGTKLASATLA